MLKFQKYLLEGLIIAFITLYAFWAIGYWMNALYGTHFDLKSCWDGFMTLSGAGFIAAVKYIMDSWKNTYEGEKPYDK